MVAHLVNDGLKMAENMRVLSYQTDKNRNLKPSSALRYLQEIAGVHCEKFGYGVPQMCENDMMFILIAVSIDFNKMPVLYDEITVETWSRGVKGIQFERPSRILDDQGSELAIASTKWVVVNTKTRKLLKPSELTDFKVPVYNEGYNLRDKKINLPSDMCFMGERKIMFSDIDYNGHVNNCCYADFMLDYMPDDIFLKRMSKLDIYFHSEALYNDKIKIYAKKKDNFYYFQGVHERGICFDARCEMCKID